MEIKYIEDFNTITPNGYNNTSGGKGVVGYNYTKVAKKKISSSMKQIALSGIYKIYCYNINTKETKQFPNLKELNKSLNLKIYNSSIRSVVTNNTYILARTEHDLLEKINAFENRKHKYIIGESKLTDDMIADIKNGMKQKDFSAKYNVCKKTYYNYKNLIVII